MRPIQFSAILPVTQTDSPGNYRLSYYSDHHKIQREHGLVPGHVNNIEIKTLKEGDSFGPAIVTLHKPCASERDYQIGKKNDLRVAGTVIDLEDIGPTLLTGRDREAHLRKMAKKASKTV